jgi:hypothetical protein
MDELVNPPAPANSDVVVMKLSESGSAHAPFIYFEDASAFGCLNGIIRVTLEATRTVPNGQGGGVVNDRVLTAHLRMNIPAAQSLKAALEGALLLASPTGSDAKN